MTTTPNIDTSTDTAELFARRIATKPVFKHPLELACEDNRIGQTVICLGQGDYPRLIELAQQTREQLDAAAALILELAAERDLAAAREAAAAQVMREAAAIAAPIPCYETRHVSLGDAVRDAIAVLPITDPAAALDRLIAERVRVEVEAEREACAALAEAQHEVWNEQGNKCLVDDDVSACSDIAAAIRARGSKEGQS